MLFNAKTKNTRSFAAVEASEKAHEAAYRWQRIWRTGGGAAANSHARWQFLKLIAGRICHPENLLSTVFGQFPVHFT